MRKVLQSPALEALLAHGIQCRGKTEVEEDDDMPRRPNTQTFNWRSRSPGPRGVIWTG